MNPFTQIALPITLTDLLLAREDALRLLQDSRRILAKAEDVLKRHGPYLMPFNALPPASEDQVRQELDSRMWDRALDLTGFRQLMDAEEVKAFKASLRPAPPEFTEGNIRATFIELHIRATKMFRRGVVNVFRSLSDDYRTNEAEPFRIGRKVIMGAMVRPSYSRGLCINDGNQNYGADKLNDIDRVIKSLDGKQFQSRSLESAMNLAFRDHAVFEDSYYRAKAFRNGNLHLEFKRSDLLDKLNEQIADYYTYDALPDARAA
ncbi:DUF4942 domain-containing protein [Stutzerimonas xanthomarina]|uniref:DUF4942 domain-containing protein n=1 Tax=Stutzerimonas xanthomarina TaxID=271420 RepID=A0A427DYJ3_9GAMM|nr:DUF4942 domain-containing protein [Stutzerimonas xanthomarina]KIL03171.1 hypothetical protein QX25_18475 [Stutzerimonas stutzeri]RRV08844.1 DUF4942 domain-containing protein [Stutzerimonas xanthomarina]